MFNDFFITITNKHKIAKNGTHQFMDWWYQPNNETQVSHIRLFYDHNNPTCDRTKENHVWMYNISDKQTGQYYTPVSGWCVGRVVLTNSLTFFYMSIIQGECRGNDEVATFNNYDLPALKMTTSDDTSKYPWWESQFTFLTYWFIYI